MSEISADDLYRQSKRRRRGGQRMSDGSLMHASGLSNRVYRALARTHNPELFRSDGSIVVEELRKLVESGGIWAVNQIGDSAVRQICLWLEERHGKVDS